MLVIKNGQIGTLREYARSRFEAEMVTHLQEFSPPLARALGEAALRRAIRRGMARASGHGLTFRGPVRLYLESMLLFGSHFDTDPQYQWAAEILGGGSPGDQMQRADLLYARIVDYREVVTGQDDTFTLEALRKILELSRTTLNISDRDLVPTMLAELKRLYPQKAAYTGRAALEILIHNGIEVARVYRFETVREAALIVILMLAFGHGCVDDPLYPWIGETLGDQRITSAAARARRLEAKAVTWLSHVLSNFGDAQP